MTSTRKPKTLWEQIEAERQMKLKQLKRKKFRIKAKLFLTIILPIFVVLLAIKVSQTFLRIKMREVFTGSGKAGKTAAGTGKAFGKMAGVTAGTPAEKTEASAGTAKAAAPEYTESTNTAETANVSTDSPVTGDPAVKPTPAVMTPIAREFITPEPVSVPVEKKEDAAVPPASESIAAVPPASESVTIEPMEPDSPDDL